MEADSSAFKQAGSFGLAGLGIFCFCFTFLYLACIHGNPFKHPARPLVATNCLHESADYIENDNNQADAIKKIIDSERKTICEDMKGYEYPEGISNTSTLSRLEDFLIENNGTPVRSIILSTFRSGSSFFGEIIAEHPGNFYHWEPLYDFDFVQIRGPPLAAKALGRLRASLNCDYSNQREYFEFGKENRWAIDKNKYLKERCRSQLSLCDNHKFFSASCKIFPFQSMKLVRLRLNVAQELIADEKLNVRLVLLVRDPRGIMQSRKHVYFNVASPDSSDPGLLCADLVADYKLSVKLLQKYPTKFRALRYEDLATDPYNQTAEILKFFGRNFHPKVINYLDTHTNEDEGTEFSTQRNSRTTPFHWRLDMKFEEVEEIQQTCAIAMKYWGYLPAMNASHQIEFNPVTEYVFN